MRLLPLLGLILVAAASPFAAETPRVGGTAPDFALTSLDGAAVRLAGITEKGNVVLVVLRGWPGYQCPLCDRQVNEFIGAKAAFAEVKAQLVFVYPGPAPELTARAAEFRALKGREWPAQFHLLLDRRNSRKLGGQFFGQHRVSGNDDKKWVRQLRIAFARVRARVSSATLRVIRRRCLTARR
jgi:peroxiredoxin